VDETMNKAGKNIKRFEEISIKRTKTWKSGSPSSYSLSQKSWII